MRPRLMIPCAGHRHRALGSLNRHTRRIPLHRTQSQEPYHAATVVENARIRGDLVYGPVLPSMVSDLTLLILFVRRVES